MLATVCLAVVGKHAAATGAAALSAPPQCAQRYSGFRIARCSGYMLGEPPHFSTREHNPSRTYAEKVCVDKRLRLAMAAGHCLVYGIGVANDWTFERSLAERGCEVHLFDPTVKHAARPDARFRNIAFHEWGLQSASTVAYNESASRKQHHYGTVHGTLLSFSAMRQKLGHENRTISVLKVDCEGCEWEALTQIPRVSWDKVDQFVVELHMGTANGFQSDADLRRATQLVTLLSSTGLRLWYSEPNVGGDAKLAAVMPPLLAAGYPASEGSNVQQGWIR